MAGAHFFFRRAGADFRIVSRADAFFRHAPSQFAGKIGLLQFQLLSPAQAGAHRLILIQPGTAGSGGHGTPRNHLIKQQGVEHLRRRAAQFLRQFLGGIGQVRKADFLPIHLGDHGVPRRRGWGGLGQARLGKGHPQQQRQGGAKGGRGGRAARMAHRGWSQFGDRPGTWPKRPFPTRRKR